MLNSTAPGTKKMPSTAVASQPVETPDDSGFEALLKPLNDILSKVWDIALTKCLEGYLDHIRVGNSSDDAPASYFNFIQAAVLVHNSATFYCKRVDSVYIGCQRFLNTLLVIERGEENLEENGVVTKRKRVQKTLQSDSFELPDIADLVSDHNINLKPAKGKTAERKKLILNKFVKTAVKPNTSIPVFQSKGLEMGFKDEFRLHWCMTSKGLLCEDFDYNVDSSALLFEAADHNTDLFTSRLESFRDATCNNQAPEPMDVDDCDDVHEDGVPSPSEIHPASPGIQPLSAVPEPPAKKSAEMKEVSYDFFIPLTLYSKRKTFKVPEDIINEIENKRKKSKKNGDKENSPSNSISSPVFDVYFNFDKYYELTVLPDYKIKKAQSARRKEKIRLANAKAVKNAAMEYNKDFLGFDLDGCDDGYDDNGNDAADDNMELDDNGLDMGLIPPVPTQDSVDAFEQNMALTMQQYQKDKKSNAKELTEVAKRVAAWHESLQSMLDQAEARSQFDIHSYGTQILDKLPETPSQHLVKFGEIVKGEPKPEISRYLLSTLMLANTYNVEIVLSEKGSLVKDCLELKLLSKVRHHEEMDEEMENIRH